MQREPIYHVRFFTHVNIVHFHKAAFNNELGRAPPSHAPRTDGGWMNEGLSLSHSLRNL